MTFNQHLTFIREFSLFCGTYEVSWNIGQVWWNFGRICWPDPFWTIWRLGVLLPCKLHTKQFLICKLVKKYPCNVQYSTKTSVIPRNNLNSLLPQRWAIYLSSTGRSFVYWYRRRLQLGRDILKLWGNMWDRLHSLPQYNRSSWCSCSNNWKQNVMYGFKW